ncbi:USP6 N-terminal-like protein [Vulpes lagopus]
MRTQAGKAPTPLKGTRAWPTRREEGYCQGTSEIAAILLMFLPEEDAFWALAQLMTNDRHAMHEDEEQMCTGIYTPKWFLQCFIDWTPFLLTLKLWDAYILDGEQVLTLMAYTILKVHRTSGNPGQAWACGHPLQDLAGPDEFPMRALGLEQVSPVPGPLLPSPAAEPPPRVDEQASPGPATQTEPPGPSPGQAILKAEEPLQEERSSEPTAAHLCPGTLGAPLLAQLPPAQDPSLAQLPPSDGTPSSCSQCNKTVQAGGPQTWA